MNKNSLLILAVTILLVACGGGVSDKKAELEKLKKERASLETKILALEEEEAKTDTTAAEKLTDVVVKPLMPVTFKSYIEVQGRVDAEESVSLATEMPGTVTKINVKAGDRVTKGQILAETDARAMLQQLADLQVNLELSKQVFEKQKNLWEQKIGTEIQYLQSKNTKESLELKISALQEQLRMTKIISPIDGTVDLVNLKIGQAVAPGYGVINVVNFSNLKVKADVAETYASRVKNNNEVLVMFPDMNDTVISKINYASRGINALTRTFAVEVLLNGKKEFHPNTVAKLKINDYQSAKPVIVVPVKFIQKTSDASYVMVSANGVAVQKMVTVGREYNGVAEILTGLKEGDLMITQGYDLVNDGTKINAKK
ncbi:efflux RND transporter periplasmic adaptor subunit [Aurantibacillus circumpalustris]|uniref:efflux RND transporter periplasmic adaptor subunit n=1 Tax=Aurantibacillus circumpalustris TaxID=3036359 RepID=UPI00295BE6B6|nr:efflux RND transporter periplasmic adaptor subunit [Aurantibacillus circumpalustris]